MRPTLLAVPLAHEEVLGVGGHVEAQREGEVGVDLLLHHGHHVEGVAHRVEAQDARELLETRPGCCGETRVNRQDQEREGIERDNGLGLVVERPSESIDKTRRERE